MNNIGDLADTRLEGFDKKKLAKKMKDPKFYIENFCKIKSKERGLVPFELKEAQKDLFNAMDKHNRIIILKARQIGFCLCTSTKVLTADLKWKEIGDVEIGDELVATEEGRGYFFEPGYAVVEDKWTKTEEAYEITLENGKSVVATKDHRFFTADHKTIKDWRAVEDIEPGYSFLHINDLWTEIKSIEPVGETEVVDIQTSTGTFIAEGFVSHNSTAVTGFFYHDTITTPGTNTALIGYNSDLTKELMQKVKIFYQTTPEPVRPTIEYNSKKEISFPKINSKIYILPSTGDVGRGYTLHNVLVTELAFWEKAEEKMTALQAAVPSSGNMVIESTPNGVGNLYHRMWSAKDNGWEKRKYGWWWNYSKEEIERIRKQMNDPQRFAQEYELEFLAAGRPVFAPKIIKQQRENILKPGDEREDVEDGYRVKKIDGWNIYRKPDPDGLYVMGADVAEGVQGGDYSVAMIFDRRTGEEVAMFRGHVATDMFARKIDKVGKLYNNALAVVEVNNHGLATLNELKRIGYPNIYYRPSKFESAANPMSDKMGWRTTKKTRPLMIHDLSQAVREGDLTLHSKKLLDEMLVFVYNDNNDMEPQEGYHDDTIFAAALAVQGFKSMYHKEPEQLDYSHELPQNFAY